MTAVEPIVAYTPDLLDRSKISAAAPGRVRFVRDAAALVGLAGAEVVVVDLRQPGVLDVLPNLSGRVIAYGSHVDTERLDAARAAGCGEVLSRSVFFNKVAELLAE